MGLDDMNFWKSVASQSKLEKFLDKWPLPDIKYNYVVLLLSEMYWLLVPFPIDFLIDHNVRPQSETKTLTYVRIFYVLSGWYTSTLR